ncbi:LysR family transcriptional regulator, partial [Burkholderia multivorans]
VATRRWVVAVMRPDTAERVAVRRVLDALKRTDEGRASPEAGTPPSR